jgi:protein gp37
MTMPAKTDIQWTDYSSNPVKLKLHKSKKTVNACIKVSPGCRGCYAEGITRHWWPKIEGKFPGYTPALMKLGDIVLNEDEIHKLLTFKPKPPFKNGEKPMVFMEDMSDMGGEFVSDAILDQLFAVFVLRPDVIFQVLTKRPERMAAYLNAPFVCNRILEAMQKVDPKRGVWSWPGRKEAFASIWLGTSVENQKCADERIPHLLRCPAAVRFLSCEPLLEGVDLSKVPKPKFTPVRGEEPAVDWVIVGGESGPSARPFDVAWARSIIKQCKAAGTACFVKQLGARPVVTVPNSIGLSLQQDIEAIVDEWPVDFEDADHETNTWRAKIADSHGGAPEEWPADLRVREFPATLGVAR